MYKNIFLHWKSKSHKDEFDVLNKFSRLYFNKLLRSFPEYQYLIKATKALGHSNILDIGCATGYTYRFLSYNCNNFSYNGADVSNIAIRRAKSLYPKAKFIYLSDPKISLKKKLKKKYDIVFSRDTIVHQTKPYVFLKNLIDITKKVLILKPNMTRDKGKTIFNPNISCQKASFGHGDLWVPIIVLNFDELINFIKKNKRVSKITVNRSYEILGGHNYRFLPKELYLQKTGTAMTSLMIEFDENKRKNFKFIKNYKLQGEPYFSKKKLPFLFLKIYNKLILSIFK